jgi:hypothetical protein
MNKLYEYLRSQFSNLDECVDWYSKWVENDQEIEGFEGCYSMRAMAYHCSRVLEGFDDQEEGIVATSYIETKYGSSIYFMDKESTPMSLEDKIKALDAMTPPQPGGLHTGGIIIDGEKPEIVVPCPIIPSEVKTELKGEVLKIEIDPDNIDGF